MEPLVEARRRQVDYNSQSAARRGRRAYNSRQPLRAILLFFFFPLPVSFQLLLPTAKTTIPTRPRALRSGLQEWAVTGSHSGHRSWRRLQARERASSERRGRRPGPPAVLGGDDPSRKGGKSGLPTRGTWRQGARAKPRARLARNRWQLRNPPQPHPEGGPRSYVAWQGVCMCV